MDSPNKLTVVDTITTTRGARTMTFDPSTQRIYTAAPNYAAADPGARPTAVPDSFHVLIFERR